MRATQSPIRRWAAPARVGASVFAACCFALALASPQPAEAQATEPAQSAPTPPIYLPEQYQGRQNMDEAEFRSVVEGKTLYFELPDGSHWGREYYAPGSDQTVFQYPDGECLEGRYALVGDRYCYYYRSQPSCWLTFWDDDGRLTVVSRRGDVQHVSQIVSDEPLSCKGDLLSGFGTPLEAPGREGG